MARSSALPYLALAAVCIIWGTTYLALRIAVANFPPFLFTAIRQVAAGLILLAFTFTIAKAAFPTREQLLQQAIAGFFMISLGNGLVAWGEVYIPSGVAAIICSLVPVLVIILNILVHKEEKPNLPIIGGVLLGLVGIVIIFSEDIASFSSPEYVGGIVAVFVATLAWAGSSIWIKRKHIKNDPFVSAGLQMFFGGLWLVPFIFAFEDFGNLVWSGEVVWALLYLVAIGSVVAYACYAYALKHLPMTVVSLYAYINPLVAIILGWWVLDEALNGKIWFAMILTITGIYVVNKGYQLRTQRSVAGSQ